MVRVVTRWTGQQYGTGHTCTSAAVQSGHRLAIDQFTSLVDSGDAIIPLFRHQPTLFFEHIRESNQPSGRGGRDPDPSDDGSSDSAGSPTAAPAAGPSALAAPAVASPAAEAEGQSVLHIWKAFSLDGFHLSHPSASHSIGGGWAGVQCSSGRAGQMIHGWTVVDCSPTSRPIGWPFPVCSVAWSPPSLRAPGPSIERTEPLRAGSVMVTGIVRRRGHQEEGAHQLAHGRPREGCLAGGLRVEPHCAAGPLRHLHRAIRGLRASLCMSRRHGHAYWLGLACRTHSFPSIGRRQDRHGHGPHLVQPSDRDDHRQVARRAAQGALGNRSATGGGRQPAASSKVHRG